jgi:LPS sulfotransferase NodH
MLCDILAATELAGAPTEYFDDNQRAVFARHWSVAPDAREYLDAMIARKTSPNGVFGMKAFIGHLRVELRGFDLDREFPHLRLVYVRRRDHVRQAVSWSRAIQTGQWASDHPILRGGELRFDADEIASLIERIEREERLWEKLFAEREQEPLRIDYEDLAPDPATAVRRVLELIGVESGPGFEPPAPTIMRQADDLSQEWVRRYRAGAT